MNQWRETSQAVSKQTDDYLKDAEPPNTTKCTKTAINAFHEVMREVDKKEGKPSGTILDTPEEELPSRLELFSRVVMKEDGLPLNASSLSSYLNSLRRILKVERSIA